MQQLQVDAADETERQRLDGVAADEQKVSDAQRPRKNKMGTTHCEKSSSVTRLQDPISKGMLFIRFEPEQIYRGKMSV